MREFLLRDERTICICIRVDIKTGDSWLQTAVMGTIHAIHPAAAAVGCQAPKTIAYGRPFIWCYLHRSSSLSLSFSSLSSCACVRNVRARQRVPLIMWGFSVLSRRFYVCAYSYYMVHKHAFVKIDLIHMYVYICSHITIYIYTHVYI